MLHPNRSYNSFFPPIAMAPLGCNSELYALVLVMLQLINVVLEKPFKLIKFYCTFFVKQTCKLCVTITSKQQNKPILTPNNYKIHTTPGSKAPKLYLTSPGP